VPDLDSSGRFPLDPRADPTPAVSLRDGGGEKGEEVNRNTSTGGQSGRAQDPGCTRRSEEAKMEGGALSTHPTDYSIYQFRFCMMTSMTSGDTRQTIAWNCQILCKESNRRKLGR